jgi:hypothetical protein
MVFGGRNWEVNNGNEIIKFNFVIEKQSKYNSSAQIEYR